MQESDGISLTGCEGQAEANKDGIMCLQFNQTIEITVSNVLVKNSFVVLNFCI